MNGDVLNFFGDMAGSADLQKNSVKLAKNSDFSKLDAEFIMRYSSKDSKILDLASGTGLIINKLYKNVKKIVAVEAYKEFTQFIEESENIEIIHEDIMNFIPFEKYDLITFFGIMNYFTEEEAKKIYRKYSKYLLPKGKVLIKNQFGVKEDVFISGFSEELQKEYFSEYRHIDKECVLLEEIGYRNIQSVDIYPEECNRWENTHFYAIVAEL